MPENKFSCGMPGCSSGKETVSIETNRILDSCRDRDCFENVRVMLTDFGQSIIEHTSNVRVKRAYLSSASITLDPVQFSRGFYTVNIRFYVKLCFEACVGNGRAQEFEGIAAVEKKVVLFGGESNVSIFRSNAVADSFCTPSEPVTGTRNVPSAVVEVVDPIILNAKILEDQREPCCCCCCAAEVPESVTYNLDGQLIDHSGDNERYLVVSLGIFSVVRIVRPAEYLISATEYSVPDKECVPNRESDPCGIFRNMAFPTSEFNPSAVACGDVEKRCGCQS